MNTGGLGILGTLTTNGEMTEGAVRNLSITAGQANTFTVGFDYENADSAAAEEIEVAAIVDGVVAGIIEPNETHNIEPQSSGSHEINVVLYRWDDDIVQPPFVEYGDRIRLEWARIAATDAAAFRVYWDNSTGTVDTSTPLATVDLIEAETRRYIETSSGTGTGRINVSGYYSGGQSNTNWTVTVTSSGWTFSTQNGASGETLMLRQGVAFNLPDGLNVTFEDTPSAYVDGDTFEFFVGPRRYFITDALAAGSYKFQLSALDAVGNESSLSGEVTISHAPEPQPPTDISATWDSGASELSISWTASETAGATYGVFSNYNPIFGDLDEYVFEASPWQTTGSTSLTISLPSNPGTVKLYVRAVASGIYERNATLLSVDCSAAPQSTVVAPSLETATATAGGKVTLTWSQSLSGGTPASFEVLSNSSDTFTGATTEATVSYSFTPTALSGSLASSHSWESSDTVSGVKWWGVRALDSGWNRTGETSMIQVTPDNVAPSAPTGLTGESV